MIMAGRVTFTFDDGLDSGYLNVFPVFQARGVHGVACVNSLNIEAGGFIKWSELHTMWQAGWEVANHGYAHLRLTAITEAQARYEVMRGKSDIEHIGLMPCPSFAYPFGSFNVTAQRIVARFHSAARVNSGIAEQYPLDVHQLMAVPIDDIQDPARLAVYKGMMDAALTGNLWQIFYGHSFSGVGLTNLDTLVGHAKTIGIPVVTLEEGRELTPHGWQSSVGNIVEALPDTGIVGLPDAATTVVVTWKKPKYGLHRWYVHTFSFNNSHSLHEFFILCRGNALSIYSRAIQTNGVLVPDAVDNGDGTYSIRVTNTSGSGRNARVQLVEDLGRFYDNA